ncbi:MAG: CPBP family intramembrane metalloprotease [Lachnospiraceae bacterium]|nr:CPBP family intramembrane metalloprotease [Lachnospiraceae bacterium]
MEQKKLKPWHGIVVFVAVMVVFVFVAIPIQAVLGLFGVAITELILLAMAIGAALLFKQNLKEVFPIKLPKLREALGVLVFWLGGFLLAMMGNMAVALLFPQELNAVSGDLNSIFSSEGMVFGILIVSFMPAICEEAVHRGFILHTFKGVKKPWVIVLSMGIIFGLFHLSPYRFIQTAVLGGCATWVMLKTENMVCPAIYHGVNNLLPVLVSFALQDAAEAATAVAESQSVSAATAVEVPGWMAAVGGIGTYMMLGLVALPLMLAGTALMKKKGEKIKGKHVAAVFIIAGAMFIIGLGMLIGASVALVMEQGIAM